MRYAIIVKETEQDFANRNNADAPTYWGAYMAYNQALEAAGKVTGGAALETPDTATNLRIRDGKTEIQDGPFADAKEEIGGFFVIDAADLDEALDWAAKCPAASAASVEVRPLMSMPPASEK